MGSSESLSFWEHGFGVVGADNANICSSSRVIPCNPWLGRASLSGPFKPWLLFAVVFASCLGFVGVGARLAFYRLALVAPW